eukprot:SM000003S11082  [mRNA]  locus=s3:726118:730024:- [translate_table: standard]
MSEGDSGTFGADDFGGGGGGGAGGNDDSFGGSGGFASRGDDGFGNEHSAAGASGQFGDADFARQPEGGSWWPSIAAGGAGFAAGAAVASLLNRGTTSQQYYQTYPTSGYPNTGYPYYEERHDDSRQLGYSYRERPTRVSRKPAWSGLITFSNILVCFVAVWLLFGVYSSEDLDLGQYESRLIQASSFFVKALQASAMSVNHGDISSVGDGCNVNSFRRTPPLDGFRVWKHSHKDVQLRGQGYQTWALWLIKGSSVQLDVDVYSDRPIYLYIIRGKEQLQSWKARPISFREYLHSERIVGSSTVTFVAHQNGDYFFAFGNFQRNTNKVSSIPSSRVIWHVLYFLAEWSASKTYAALAASASATVTLMLWTYPYVIITDAGLTIFITFLIDAWFGYRQSVTAWEQDLLLPSSGAPWAHSDIDAREQHLPWSVAHQERPDKRAKEPQGSVPGSYPFVEPSKATSVPFSAAPSAPPLSQGARSSAEESGTDETCTVCMESAKDCIFDPCGHRATCYACGVRLAQEKSSQCPICRSRIRQVLRVYDS